MREKVDSAYTEVLIIGAGPAGMYAADELQRLGMKDITIIDMGRQMKHRRCPQTDACNCKVCDILEGEGGAGGFSDGKKTYSLTRGTQMEELFDPKHESLLKVVDDRIVTFGIEGKSFDPLPEVPEEFVDSPFEFGSYPLRHIGSDGVRRFIINYGEYLKAKGVKTIYNMKAKTLVVSNGQAVGAVLEDVYNGDPMLVRAKYVVVATGLQGAPWLERQLEAIGVSLGVGPAGIGLRVEAHHEVLAPLFDRFYDFKLVYGYDGMTFRSFCCNRRGHITNENHRTLGIRNVNGHSYIDPKLASNASNFAVICKVGLDKAVMPQVYVRKIARDINALTGGMSVVQRAVDFVNSRPTTDDDLRDSQVRTNTQSMANVDISKAMPEDIYQGFRNFIIELDKVVPGVLRDDTLIYAPEVKYYSKKSPVNFDTWECKEVPGLYILGNASGYLDSFVSAALTGLIAAQDIIEKQNRGND